MRAENKTGFDGDQTNQIPKPPSEITQNKGLTNGSRI